MDDIQDEQNKKDLDILLKKWKEIPVISSKIFMKSFPYIQSPWEHWNTIVDELKETRHNTNCGSTQDDDNKDIICQKDKTHRDLTEDNDDVSCVKKETDVKSSGYMTDISEISDDEDNYTTNSCNVDWESDNEF